MLSLSWRNHFSGCIISNFFHFIITIIIIITVTIIVIIIIDVIIIIVTTIIVIIIVIIICVPIIIVVIIEVTYNERKSKEIKLIDRLINMWWNVKMGKLKLKSKGITKKGGIA